MDPRSFGVVGNTVALAILGLLTLGFFAVAFNFFKKKLNKQALQEDEIKSWKDCIHCVALALCCVVACLFTWQARGDAYFNDGMDYHQQGDWKNAVEKWKVASEKGHHGAEFNLGLIYQQGGHGIVENHQEAAKWYGLAAEGGLPEAQLNLAVLYMNGQGVPRNPAKSVEWMKKAAKQGLKEAKENLENIGIYDYD